MIQSLPALKVPTNPAPLALEAAAEPIFSAEDVMSVNGSSKSPFADASPAIFHIYVFFVCVRLRERNLFTPRECESLFVVKKLLT